MKKTILTLSVIFAFSGIAFADGNAFTPLNFNDTSYGTTSSAPTAQQSLNCRSRWQCAAAPAVLL